MKSILEPYFSFICSAMSVTGPQTRDWHSCGVENSSATGLVPTTSANDFSCSSGAGGWRVSIFSSSPLADSIVSVSTFGADWPTSGLVAPLARDLHLRGRGHEPAVRLRHDEHGPRALLGERHVGGVDGGEGSVSVAACLERYAGAVISRSAGAGIRAAGLGARRRRDVHRALAVHELAVGVDHPERQPVEPGGEHGAGQRRLRPAGHRVRDLLQAAALDGREVGRRGRGGARSLSRSPPFSGTCLSGSRASSEPPPQPAARTPAAISAMMHASRTIERMSLDTRASGLMSTTTATVTTTPWRPTPTGGGWRSHSG